MRYGIVIYPEQEIQERANALRMRYDSHYALIAPHITLKEPFEVKEKDLDNVIQTIEELVANTPPFNLTINKVGSFIPTSPVIFYGFEKNSNIVDLYEKLNSGILYQPSVHAFVPHITIAQDLSEAELTDLYNRFKLHQFNIGVSVKEIHLLYQTENKTWKTHKTFSLNEKA